MQRVKPGDIINTTEDKEDIGGNARSIGSFGDDVSPMDDDFALDDDLLPAPAHEQDEIVFARDDEPPASDPANEADFDVSTSGLRLMAAPFNMI